MKINKSQYLKIGFLLKKTRKNKQERSFFRNCRYIIKQKRIKSCFDQMINNTNNNIRINHFNQMKNNKKRNRLILIFAEAVKYSGKQIKKSKWIYKDSKRIFSKIDKKNLIMN